MWVSVAEIMKMVEAEIGDQHRYRVAVRDDQNDLALVLFENVFEDWLGIAGIVVVDFQVECIGERPRRVLCAPSWRCVYCVDAGNNISVDKATRKGITLGNYQEARIRRFHLTLDEYLSPKS